MTTNDVERLLRRLAAAEAAAEAADSAPPLAWPRPDCVPTSRLVSIYTSQEAASDAERTHIATCPYCGRAAQRLDGAPAVDPVWEELLPNEPAVPSELVATSNVWARPEPSWAGMFRSVGGSADTSDSTARTVRVFSVGGASGVPLTPELAAHYFGEPTLNAVQLGLALYPIDGGWEPRVQLEICPNRGHALAVTLTFPGGVARTFLLPSGLPGSTDSVTSEPAEPLPESAEAALSAGWETSIELT